MSRFLRVFAIVFGLFFAGNALAVDYTCDTVMQYDSCAAGYYMTLNGEYNGTPTVGNACTACPGDAAACPGGTYAPVYTVTLQASGGTLPSSSNTIYRTKNVDTGYIFDSADVSTANVITKIELPTRNNYSFKGYYTSTSSSAPQIFNASGYLVNSDFATDTGNITLYAQWSSTLSCAPGTYIANNQCVECIPNFFCPGGTSAPVSCEDVTGSAYSFSMPSAAHRTECFTPIQPGYRVMVPTTTTTAIPTGVWATGAPITDVSEYLRKPSLLRAIANNVKFGSRSPVLYLPNQFYNAAGSGVAYHRAIDNANPIGRMIATNNKGYNVENYARPGDVMAFTFNNAINILEIKAYTEGGVQVPITIINNPTSISNGIGTGTKSVLTDGIESVGDIIKACGASADLTCMKNYVLTTTNQIQFVSNGVPVIYVELVLLGANALSAALQAKGNTSSTAYSSTVTTSIPFRFLVNNDLQFTNVGDTNAATTPVASTANFILGIARRKSCDAGKYAAGSTRATTAPNMQLETLQSCNAVSAGYYSTGGGTSATPTAAGNGCLNGAECGPIDAGYYGAAGATTSTGSGPVDAGYYSTGGGTSATPTAAGDGCISSAECGLIAAGYYGSAGATTSTGNGTVVAGHYSTGGGTSATPITAGTDCVSGQDCGYIQSGCYGGEGSTSACPNSCPAAETGWTLSSNTGLTDATDCTEEIDVSNVSGNSCTSGLLIKNAIDASTWGEANGVSLTADANAYVDGTTCSACPAEYPNSDGGAIDVTSCYTTCPEQPGYELTGGHDYNGAEDTCEYIEIGCFAVELNANGGEYNANMNNYLPTHKVYKKTGSSAIYSDASCTTELLIWEQNRSIMNGAVRTGYALVGWTELDRATDITATKTVNDVWVPGRSVLLSADNIGAPMTLYALWAKDCPSSVSNGTCERTVDYSGETDIIFTYNTSCLNGYTATSGAGSANIVCQGNEITVDYNENGGSSVENGICTYGDWLTMPATPTRTGYTSPYWVSANAEYYAAGTAMPCNSTTLGVDSGTSTAVTAAWQPNEYEVDYNCGDGTGSEPAATAVTYNSNFTPAANTCSRTGYTFAGWTVSGTSDVKDAGTAFQWNYPENKTFTAKWTANTYNVSYSCGDGSGTAPSKTTVTYNSSFTPAANTCSRTGYTFAGWLVSDTNDETLSAGTANSWVYAENKTLTAKWNANTFAITYAGNGNTGGSAPTVPTQCQYDSDCVAPANTYTNTNNIFRGWECTGGTSACDGDIITAGASLKNVSTGSTITLTAQWVECTTCTTEYSCDPFRRYTSCNSGYYMTASPLSTIFDNAKELGNYCAQCPDNAAYCPGGLNAPIYAVTLNPNGGTSGTGTKIYHSATAGYCSAADANCVSGGSAVISSFGASYVPTRTGYTYGGFATTADATSADAVKTDGTISFTYTAAEPDEWYAVWTANTNTKYVVNHYTKNVGASTYTLNSTENKTGTSDSSLTLTNLKKTITGFTYSEGFAGTATNGTTKPTSGAVTATSILPNGTRVIDLYYTRNTYTITATAGRGISTVAGSGWTNTGTATMTKSYEYGATIALSSVVTPTHKAGYTGASYSVTTGSGSINNGTYTVGTGAGTITVNATGITAPAGVTLTPTSTTKVYNYQNTTLTGATSTSYDSGITVYYNFGNSSTSDGTYTYGTTAGTTKTTTVSAAAYRGTKYYKVQVYATDGTLTSSTTTSSAASVTLNNKKITFNATSNGGTLSGTSPLYVSYNNASVYTGATNSTAGTVPTATKTGYSFAGWYTAATGGSQIYNASGTLTSSAVSGYTNGSKWVATADQTLYAQFTPCTYTVTYNANGGSGTTASSTHTYDTAKALTTNAFTRTGYTFAGWNTKTDGSGTSYSNDASVTNLTSTCGGSVTLYAKWEPKIYTITLRNYNDSGTHSTIYEKYATGWYSNNTASTSISKATVPTRTGYTFRGFYTAKQDDLTATGGMGKPQISNDGTLPASTIFTANTKLYAAWAKDCTQPSNGTCSLTINSNGQAIYSTRCDTGYTISGANTATPTCSASKYTIVYDPNGGEGSMASSSHTYGVAKNLTTNSFTNGLKEFRGWALTSSATVPEYSNAESVSNLATIDGATITLYAVWGPCSTCTTGYSCDPYRQYYYCKPGYYMTASPLSTVFNNDQGTGNYCAPCPDDASSCPGGLNAPIYEVTLNPNGGTSGTSTKIYHSATAGYCSAADANCVSGGSAVITSLGASYIPTRTGYTYGGFATTADATSADAVKTDGTISFTYTAAEPDEWYAVWTANTNTKYVVNHYTKNVGASTYTLNSTENKTGTSDSSLTLTNLKKTITGFTYSEGFAGTATNGTTKPTSGAVTATSILPNGTRVIDLYYTRNTYTITATAGRGISTVAGSGWTNTGTATMTKSYEYGATIALSSVVTPTHKAGYTGASYSVTTGSGSISNGTYTVGTGAGTITVAATGITAPAGVTLTPTSTTKVYNYQNTTLTGATSTSYDSGITVYYNFGNSSTSDGTYTYGTTAGTTKTTTVSAAAYRGTKYYKVQVYATDGTLKSSTTTSSAASVTLNNKKITFNATSNGGTLSGTSPLYVSYNNASVYTGATNSTAGTVPTATKTGYSFAGWYTAATGGSQIYNASGALTSSAVSGYTNGSKWVATADQTLYAQFTPCTYTVTYNANGGSGTTASSTHTYDTAKALTTNAFTRTGYTFAGWNTKTDGSGTSYSNGASVTNLTSACGGSVTLYAQWTLNTYTIAYILNGGTNYNGAPTSYNVTTSTITLGTPTRANSTFGGWYTESTFANKVTQIANGSTGNKSFYAKWSCNTGYTANSDNTACVANTYTVSYELDSGTHGSSHPTSATFNTAFTVSNPTRNGYTFTGWKITGMDSVTHTYGSSTTTSTSISSTKETSFKNLRSTSGTVTFTAQWSVNTYTITYYNGSTKITTLTPTSYTIETATFSLPTAYTSGSKFVSWHTDSALSSSAVTQIAKGTTGNKTFYAKWETCPEGSVCNGSTVTTCPAGSFCVAGSSAGTKCAIGSYSAAGSSTCTACQNGTTTSGEGQTSCNTTCSNNGDYANAWKTTTWAATNTMSNVCTIDNCTAGSKYASANGGSCTACTSGTYMSSSAHTNTTCTPASQNYYVDGNGQTSQKACSSLANTDGFYSKTDSTGSTSSSCYGETSSGMIIKTQYSGALSKCSSGNYCPDAKVYYGAVSEQISCLTVGGGLYTESEASSEAPEDCYAEIPATKYIAKPTDTTTTTCTAGYYCQGSAREHYSATATAQGRKACNVGTYQPATGQTSCLTADAGYYVPSTAQTKQTACSGATYQPDTGKSSCLSCPTATNDTANISSYNYYNTGASGDHTVRSGCYANFKSKTLDDGVMTSYHCYVDSGANTYGANGTSKTCWVNKSDLTCNGGYYNTVFNDSSTATQYSSNTTLTNLYTNVCQEVESGYWSANDALTRTACATGLVTCGSGTCANEADDCGRKLHMGDNTIYLRSDKRTTPSLRVMVGDKTFYGALSTSLSSKAKVKKDGTTYSVVNDYQ